MSDPIEWQRARRERKADERRLPDALRRQTRRIKRSDLGHHVVSTILDDVKERARQAELLVTVTSIDDEPWSYVPADVEEDILQKLAANSQYVAQVRRRVDEALRVAHVARVQPEQYFELPEALPPVFKADDELVVRSDIGLGTASVLEAEPEEWNHWVASQIDGARDVDDLELGGPVPVVVLGALAGGFARAVRVTGAYIRVAELDWIWDEATQLPCVESRDAAWKDGVFDAAVVVLPSSSTSGAANQRCIYRDGGMPRAETGGDRNIKGPGDKGYDLSSRGPRRWSREALGYLAVVNARLPLGALAYVLLPLGIRDERGYIAAPDLLGEALERIGEAGFHVVQRLPTFEVAPVAQPFVGHQRPERVTLVVKKTSHVEGL